MDRSVEKLEALVRAAQSAYSFIEFHTGGVESTYAAGALGDALDSILGFGHRVPNPLNPAQIRHEHESIC